MWPDLVRQYLHISGCFNFHICFHKLELLSLKDGRNKVKDRARSAYESRRKCTSGSHGQMENAIALIYYPSRPITLRRTMAGIWSWLAAWARLVQTNNESEGSEISNERGEKNKREKFGNISIIFFSFFGGRNRSRGTHLIILTRISRGLLAFLWSDSNRQLVACRIFQTGTEKYGCEE